MKRSRIICNRVLCVVFSVSVFSCGKNFTDLNINPNSAVAQDIDPGYLIKPVISTSAYWNAFIAYGSGVGHSYLCEAMQYLQRLQGQISTVNSFQWLPTSWNQGQYYVGYYYPIANASYLNSRASESSDSAFMRGIGLTISAYWYGFMASAWGDVPYSQAMKGTENVLRPVFDKQQEVLRGILVDLEAANDAFSHAQTSNFAKSSDILYAGDILKWRKFANSLHLRFLMRLSEKVADMQAIGVDIKAEFNKIVSNPNNYPLIQNSSENASVKFAGTMEYDSWPGGTIHFPSEDEYSTRKAGITLVKFLENNKDPRLTVWVRQVDVQTLVRDKGVDEIIMKDSDGKVKRYIKSYREGIDTSLFVGLPIADPNPALYNDWSSGQNSQISQLDPDIYIGSASNPFVSHLTAMYRENSNSLVRSVFVTAAEVNFLLAEAVVRGWIPGSALDYYKQGISASLSQYDINDGDIKVYNTSTHAIDPFDQDEFLAEMSDIFNQAGDKIEPIMAQSWVANFLNVEAWFNWRRTGYPNIGKNIVNGPQGEKIPVRLIYGNEEFNFNRDNTTQAINSLQPAENDQWSKTWLNQGTGKPW